MPPKPAKPKKQGKKAPGLDLKTGLYRLTGVDLATIDGIQSHTALKVLSETGTGMGRWQSAKQICSWLGLTPGCKISGGKRPGGKTKRTANRAAAALRMAVQSLSNSQSASGAFYRKKRHHLGAAKATTATAHKLARIIYAMPGKGTAYEGLGEHAYGEQYQQRVRRNLRHKAKKMGLILVYAETGEAVTD
ncbi:MAG: transposase [Methylovulum sp.]|nr:transposase [Methylovulum sp.]